MRGGVGDCLSTSSNAQASAAAAVEHHCGGMPLAVPSRSPFSDTTASPKPVALSSSSFPYCMEPSKYQVASSTAGSFRSGCLCQWRNPSCLIGGAMTLKTARPLVSSSRFRASPSLLLASSAALGGGGHPPSGRVAMHVALCWSVPTSLKQSWHRLEVVPKAATCAFLACGHWPPFMAEANMAPHFGSQIQSLGVLQDLPRTSGLIAAAKSKSTDRSPILCGTSILPGSLCRLCPVSTVAPRRHKPSLWQRENRG